MIYTSLLDLFRKWGEGKRNIEPSRRRWGLYVRDNVLYDKQTPVGLQIPGALPHSFWYLVTHFTGRFELRQRLDAYGGYPCLPHELLALLPPGTNLSASEEYRFSGKTRSSADDPGALELIRSWLVDGRIGSLHWRGCLITCEAEKLALGRVIRGQPNTLVAAAWVDETRRTLLLCQQVRRNPPGLWVRDAVYTLVGRAGGDGTLGVVVTRLWNGSRSYPLVIKPALPWVCDTLRGGSVWSPEKP